MTRPRISSLVLGAFLAGASAVSAAANINLEWRPGAQTVAVGDTVEIGLYAVSDDETAQSIAAMDVILDWDPLCLALIGVDDPEPDPWSFSGFRDDSMLDGLNDTFDDGDALYTAWALFGLPADATPEGLLVTTFQFEALAGSPGTLLTIPEHRGEYTHSRIFDGEIPGYEVQGTFGSAVVTIVCVDGCTGDLDGDCDTDLADLAILLASYEIGDGGDLDGDGDTDLADLATLLADYGCGTLP